MRYLFFGDLCITEANYQLFADGSNSIFSKELLEKVHSCDFVSFNLECPLINKDSNMHVLTDAQCKNMQDLLNIGFLVV